MGFDRRLAGSLFRYGIIGGIIAGLVFAFFEMALAAIMGMGFVAPLVMIGSILLGTQAMAPDFPVLTAAATGVALHLVLSSIYGIILLYLLAWARQLCSPAWLLFVYGSIFGLALWVVNFLVLGSLFFPQFTTLDQFWFGFVAHTFFYGTVLGAYVTAAWPARRGIPIAGLQPC